MKIGIFGAGGFGREVLPEVRRAHPHADIKFVVDSIPAAMKPVNGVDVISLDQAAEQKRLMILAVGDGATRERVYKHIDSLGMNFLNIKAENAVLYDHNDIGKCYFICSGSIITSNVKIGVGFQCNLFSYVAHDCIIGNFVTLAPRVSCNGNVIIEDGAYIGTGALLKQGSSSRPLVIGRNSVIGMGAVVTKDVAPDCTVVGNPARLLNKASN